MEILEACALFEEYGPSVEDERVEVQSEGRGAVEGEIDQYVYMIMNNDIQLTKRLEGGDV